MKPLLSVVTGTYSRLDYLRAMCKSVTDQLPPGFPYEFVVVDGGSRDGTEAWCLQQTDVVFVQQGQLQGAISAFNAGCAAARGEYVGLFNDDVLVIEGAIPRALNHLITHPDCGAVAFADDRKAPGYDTTDYKVQTIRAITQDGTPTDVVYAQCGLYRRWLGELCKWWDMDDPKQHTYGADSHLSAQIWMRSYTVDAVEGVMVKDRIAPDQLRQINSAAEQRNGSAYYRKYPNGVYLDSLPKPVNPQENTLRILYLPLFSPGFGRYKTGLYDALAKHGLVYELDYVKHKMALPSAVAAFQPHLILTQFHDANTIPPETLALARTFAPGAVVVNWNGDIYEDQLTAPKMMALLKHVDLQLVVNADVLPFYAEHSINAAYWQIGYEPVPEQLPDATAHDLLFMGNAYSPARLELAAVLRQMDANAGLYGHGWQRPSGNSFYDFAQGAALYRNCKIAIGDNQYGAKGFVSNRLFEALANGACLLQQRVPGLEELTGLVDGIHYMSWTDFDDLRDMVGYLLHHPHERQTMAALGEAFVRERHSFDARVTELFEQLLPRLEYAQPGSHDDAAPVEHSTELAWSDGIAR